ncbi:MAG: histidine kinase [Clostridia bacterium]|nr:histidine kinase [Clostridia bacterium]
MKRKRGGTSIYKRIIIMFVFIMLVFFLFSGIVTAFTARETRKSLSENVRYQAKSTLNRLEQEIGRISDSMVLLLQDEELKQFNYLKDLYSEYQLIKLINSIKDKLAFVSFTSDAIINVKVMLPTIERMYYSSHTNLDTYQEDVYLDMIRMGSQAGTLHQYNGSILLSVNSERIARPLNASAEISPQSLLGLLSGMQKEKDSDFAILGSGGLFISNMNQSQLDKLALIESGKTAFFKDHGQTLIMHSLESRYLGCTFVFSQYTNEITDKISSITFVSTLLLIVIIVFLTLSIWYMRAIINNPLNRLVGAFTEVEQGRFPRLQQQSWNEFDYLFHAFNRMSRELDQAINEVYRHKLLLREADIRQLQAQINPHFLYNSFFMLNRTVKARSFEKAEAISGMLGQYFKYITRNNQPMATMKDEYDHAGIYASVQAMRFEGRVEIEINELDKDIQEVSVPKLILQPLIENAFHYSLEPMESGGRLRITPMMSSDGYVTVEIEDNGQSLSDDALRSIRERVYRQRSPESETTALSNIHQRIMLIYGGECGLTFGRSDMGGLSVKVRLKPGGEFNFN